MNMKLSEKRLSDWFEQYQKEEQPALYNVLQKTYYPDEEKNTILQDDIEIFRIVQIGIPKGITNFSKFRSVVESVFSEMETLISYFTEKKESHKPQPQQTETQQQTTTQTKWTDDGTIEEDEDI